MTEVFSEQPEESTHYRPQIIDLTHIDDLPPPLDENGLPIIDRDWDIPDAMKVTFPKEPGKDLE
jgi:hypothetical protein